MLKKKTKRIAVTESQKEMFRRLREGKLDIRRGKGKRFFERRVASVLYEHPEHLVAHQKCVKKIAVDIGVQLRKLGKEVDVNLLDTAARFHDIARELEGFIARKHNLFLGHEIFGASILENFGLTTEAALVRAHFCETIVHPITLYEKHLSIEQKILIYADARTCNGKPSSLGERQQSVIDRTLHYTDENVAAIYGKYGIRSRDQHIRVINAVYDIMAQWEKEWGTKGIKLP